MATPLIFFSEDREVRSLIETVSHDPNDHLDALGVILKSIQLSDARPTGALEPVSVELRSMVDVVAPEAVADHGLREGSQVQVGPVAIPEVGIDADLGGTAEGTEGDLGEALLPNSVASTLIFAGCVAFVATPLIFFRSLQRLDFNFIRSSGISPGRAWVFSAIASRMTFHRLAS